MFKELIHHIQNCNIHRVSIKNCVHRVSEKTSTHIIGYKLRSSCLILIIFDTKIPHTIWHRMTANTSKVKNTVIFVVEKIEKKSVTVVISLSCIPIRIPICHQNVSTSASVCWSASCSCVTKLWIASISQFRWRVACWLRSKPITVAAGHRDGSVLLLHRPEIGRTPPMCYLCHIMRRCGRCGRCTNTLIH